MLWSVTAQKVMHDFMNIHNAFAIFFSSHVSVLIYEFQHQSVDLLVPGWSI